MEVVNMASLRGVALTVVGGIIGTCTAGGTLLVGCGPDDSSSTDGGTLDTGAPDTTTDTSPTPDTGADTRADAKDSGSDATDGALDAKDAADSAADAGRDADATPDGGDAARDGDAAGDADANLVTSDSGDSGRDADAMLGTDADAAFDADAISDGDASDASDAKTIPPGLLAYPGQYATAICTGFATCCGATFDVAACEKALTTVGYDNTLPSVGAVYDAGNLTFDANQAALCVAALQAWPCGANLASAQNQAILSACHNVLGGTIQIGSTGCSSSFECVSGAYCKSGTCTALVGDGGACAAGESIDFQCSYVGSAQPSLYCNLYPDDGGGAARVGTCLPTLANGVTSVCSDGVSYYSDYACTSHVCDYANTGACSATTANPADPTNGFECSTYVLDAGGGG
jgi:hypothetical protein